MKLSLRICLCGNGQPLFKYEKNLSVKTELVLRQYGPSRSPFSVFCCKLPLSFVYKEPNSLKIFEKETDSEDFIKMRKAYQGIFDTTKKGRRNIACSNKRPLSTMINKIQGRKFYLKYDCHRVL
jgi:hypothetical protein